MYRNVLDNFARNQLVKLPNIPDFHLMVGSAENLSSLPLLISGSVEVPTEIYKNMVSMSQLEDTEIQDSIANNTLEVNDLNWNIASLGLGGV